MGRRDRRSAANAVGFAALGTLLAVSRVAGAGGTLLAANEGRLDTSTGGDTSPASQCSELTEQTVAHCLQPILNYANTIQQQSSAEGAPFTLQGGDIFQKLCILYAQFKECIIDVHCHSISIEAVEASYGYMCGPGHVQFEQHAACFAEVESQHEYTLCRNAAGQAMDDAAKEKSEERQDAYFRRLCRIMDDYLRCCRPFVTQKCGHDAWRLVSQITMDSLRVTMPTCDVNDALL